MRVWTTIPSRPARQRWSRLQVVLPLLGALLLAACADDEPRQSPNEDAQQEDQVAPPNDTGDWLSDTPTDPEDTTSPDVPSTGGECVVDADCAGLIRRPGPCELRRCDPALGCVIDNRVDGAPCDTGDPCTVRDSCLAGVCAPGIPICECQDDADCPDDGNLCNGVLRCNKELSPFMCTVRPGSVVQCDRGQDTACLETSCDPSIGQCVKRPVNIDGPCSDRDPCTTDGRCQEDGTCLSTEVCQCRADSDCDEHDTGNRCNGTLHCDTREIPYICRLRPGTAVACSTTQNTPCRRNVCQPDTGFCVLTDLPDGSTCSDNNACTVGDQCQGGVCIPGPRKSCDDGNICTNNGCDPRTGECINEPNTASCEEVFACTTGNRCQNGRCRQGTPIVCDDGDPCTVGTCVEPTGCVFTLDPLLCPAPDVVEPDPDVVDPDVVDPTDTHDPDVPDIIVEPEVVEPDPWEPRPSGIYRFTTLRWASPALCLVVVAGEPCLPVTSSVANDLDHAVRDGANIILVEMTPLDLAAPEVALRLGAGTCGAGRGGDEICNFTAAPAPAEMNGAISTEDPCGAEGAAAPCVAAGPAPVTLSLFDVATPFAAVEVAAAIAMSYSALDEGLMRGFLAEEHAEQILVTFTGMEPVPIADLLPAEGRVTFDEQEGWWVTLTFAATER